MSSKFTNREIQRQSTIAKTVNVIKALKAMFLIAIRRHSLVV